MKRAEPTSEYTSRTVVKSEYRQQRRNSWDAQQGTVY